MMSDIIIDRHDGPWRVEVDPGDMWCNRAAARSYDDHAGTWGGSGVAVNPAGVRLHFQFGSYDTMTACVRCGFGWLWRGGQPFGGGLDIIAKDAK